MNRRHFLQTASTIAALAPTASWGGLSESEDEQARRDRWLTLAQSLKPRLNQSTVAPVNVVNPVADSAAFLRWRMDPISPASVIRKRLMRDGDSFILDFGRHITGHLTFSVVAEGREVDSPVRLKFIFAEVPVEIVEPFANYKGWLSRAWLQDEIITIDVLPATIRLPRRYAFR